MEGEHCAIWGCEHQGMMCSLCEHYLGGLEIDITAPSWWGKPLKEIEDNKGVAITEVLHVERIMMREYMPSTEWKQTEWTSLNDLMKWVQDNEFHYAIKKIFDTHYLFVLKDRRTQENDPVEHVLVYQIG